MLSSEVRPAPSADFLVVAKERLPKEEEAAVVEEEVDVLEVHCTSFRYAFFVVVEEVLVEVVPAAAPPMLTAKLSSFVRLLLCC